MKQQESAAPSTADNRYVLVKGHHKNGMVTIFLGSNALLKACELQDELSNTNNPIERLTVKGTSICLW